MYGQAAVQSKACGKISLCKHSIALCATATGFTCLLVCRSESLTIPKFQALWPGAWQVCACASLANRFCTLLTEPVRAAGTLTAVFVCPLDVLKTRLQVQGRAHAAAYKGIGGEHILLACCVYKRSIIVHSDSPTVPYDQHSNPVPSGPVCYLSI